MVDLFLKSRIVLELPDRLTAYIVLDVQCNVL